MNHTAIFIFLILYALALLFLPGCTQAEMEGALRAAHAASDAYYGPRVHLNPPVNPPGAPFPLYP